MNTYKITLKLTKDQLINFIDNGGSVASIEVIKDGVDEAKPTRLRGSKVNDTIRAALGSGPQSARALKEALEQADLSPGSLSTGLSLLQKSGEIERIGEGLYGLKVAA